MIVKLDFLPCEVIAQIHMKFSSMQEKAHTILTK